MICETNFDLNDTMSSFEVMDSKMDIRMKRFESLIPSKAIEKGILITNRELTSAEKLALLDESFI